MIPPFPGLGSRPHLAAVDIGSNTCSMVLVGRGGRDYQVLEDYSVVTGLGRDRGPNGELDGGAMERTILTLKMFRRRIDEMEVGRVAAVATAAVREAPARAALIRLIQRHAGLDVDVLSGQDEAAITYLAAAREFGGEHPLVLVDVGGGSTEVAQGRRERLDGSISVKLGAVRCSEQPLGSRSPPRARDLDTLRAAVAASLRPVASNPGATVVAVGGTPTTLLAVQDSIVAYDASRVHGRVLTAEALDHGLERLAGLDLEALERLPGMQPGRAPHLMAGGVILAAVLHHLGADRLIVSDRGLRFGLLYRAFGDLHIRT